MKALAIHGIGMVTGVGLDHQSSCAAVRAAVNAFAETGFGDSGGEQILGSEVLLGQPWRGRAKLVKMATRAVDECLAGTRSSSDTVLLLCVSERDRPGRFDGIDEHLLPEIQSELGMRFHPKSGVIARGRAGAGLALRHAADLIHDGGAEACVVAGVDTYLTARTLAACERAHRLLTSKNSNGFIPGEAAVAVLLGRRGGAPGGLECLGIGRGKEQATVESEHPLRADGLTQAIREALADSGVSYADLDYRMSDCNGEQYWFREAALAMTRTLRVRKPEFTLRHPADCIGETGAAAGAAVLAVAHASAMKGWSPGPGVLCQMGNDAGDRVAVVLHSRGERN